MLSIDRYAESISSNTLSRLILKSKKKTKVRYVKDIRFDFNQNLKKYENLITSL